MLIITCPCALGLAVPIVQVVAARRLFENGIMMKDGSAVERLAEIDAAVFDKTGTLTLGAPRLTQGEGARRDLAIAAAIAQRSNHPQSRALAAAYDAADVDLADIAEYPGLGIEARIGGAVYRLGRAEWARSDGEARAAGGAVLTCDGRQVACFGFEDALRPGARTAIETLRARRVDIALLSGDAPEAVGRVAAELGIADWHARLLPADKLARLESDAAGGRKTLMVGDGINDAPALAAAYVSMAPATAADIGRNAADFVFLRAGLDAVPKAHATSREAGRLVRQNFALAIAYNAIALPVAIAGYVTPLIAALAMSLSSIIVVANALRLSSGKDAGKAGASGKLPGAVRRPALEAGE